MTFGNCIPSLISAQKKVQEADIRGTKTGPNTFFNAFVSATCSMQEVPATWPHTPHDAPETLTKNKRHKKDKKAEATQRSYSHLTLIIQPPKSASVPT